MIPELTGKIKRDSYHEIVDYGDIVLPQSTTCWVGKNNYNVTPRTTTTLIPGKHTVYIPGNDQKFIEHILNLINNAKKIIVLSSFLLQGSAVTEALLKRTDDGIFVAVITASSEELGKADDDEFTEDTHKKQIINEHGNLLNRLVGKVLVRTAEHFHAKFILADPLDSTAAGVLMTCNATVNAMNGGNIELGIDLTKDEITSYFAFFLQGFWKEAAHELIQTNRLNPVTPNQELLSRLNLGSASNSITTFKDGKLLKSVILEVIKSAKISLDISCWTFNHDDLATAIAAKAKDGIAVRVFVHISKLNSEKLEQLLDAGVKVFGHDRLHAKYIIADRTRGVVMTANIAHHGLEEGFDGGVILQNSESQTASQIVDIVANSCSHSYVYKPKIRDFSSKVPGFYYDKRTSSRVMILCKESEEFSISINSIIDMFSPKYPDKSYISGKDTLEILQKAKFSINFAPAILPNMEQLEKEESQNPKVELYIGKGNKKKYVCVKNWEDVPLLPSYLQRGYTVATRE